MKCQLKCIFASVLFLAIVSWTYAVNFTRVTGSYNPAVAINGEDPNCWFSPKVYYAEPFVTVTLTGIVKDPNFITIEYYATGAKNGVEVVKTHIYSTVYNSKGQITGFKEDRRFTASVNKYHIEVSNVTYDATGTVQDGFSVSITAFNLQQEIEQGIWSGSLSHPPYLLEDSSISSLQFFYDNTVDGKWTLYYDKYKIVSTNVDGKFAVGSDGLINASCTGTVTEAWTGAMPVNYAMELNNGKFDPNTETITGDFILIFDIYLNVEWTRIEYDGTWTVTRKLPGQASSPKPSNLTAGARTNTQLKWTAGSNTSSHNVYFGTDPNLDPNTTFRGNQVEATYDPGLLDVSKIYYWRIDEVNPNGITPSKPWSFTVSNSPMTIQKCSVSALKTPGLGNFSFSGYFDAVDNHFLTADEIIVTLDAEDLIDPNNCIWRFPINDKTYKKGKFNCTVKGNSQSTLKIDTKTSKMSFSCKNNYLTGLACSITAEIQIGTYAKETALDETIVNGAKKSCPVQFLMGVRNTLTVSKFSQKQNSKPYADSFTVQGTFTLDSNYDKDNNPLIVTLGTQTFTVSGDQFPTAKPGIESCKKAPSTGGAVVDAKFDFVKCTYSVTVKNTDITDSGPVPFTIDCFGVNLDGFAAVSLK